MSGAGQDKNDPWADNIHFAKTHEDPTVFERLKNHNKILSESDKFIDYIHHIDSQIKSNYKCNTQELDSMNNSGVNLRD